MDDGAQPLDLVALGARVRALRRDLRLSLDELAARAGVSRSMISAVERGGKAPTVLMLDRIATALGTSLARLLSAERSERAIVLRRDEQEVARDPSGWERRILSPVLPGVEFEFMQTTIPSHVDAGVFAPHAPGTREHLVVLQGTLRLTLDEAVYLLDPGDAIYYAGDCLHGFACAGEAPCSYILAMQIAAAPGARHFSSRRPLARHGADPSPRAGPAVGRTPRETTPRTKKPARARPDTNRV